MWGQQKVALASQDERPQKKPKLPPHWSWTSSLHFCYKVNFCCLSYPVYVILLWQPKEANIHGYLSIIILKWWFLESLVGSSPSEKYPPLLEYWTIIIKYNFHEWVKEHISQGSLSFLTSRKCIMCGLGRWGEKIIK